MLLELEGFEVTTHSSSEGALAAIDASTDLFIIDCYLGQGGSGLDLLRALRDHEDGVIRDTAIIMVSGDQRLESDVVAQGADKFLLKPYAPTALVEEVKELIAAERRW
jgi:DNA-binding response OmpR family regulator